MVGEGWDQGPRDYLFQLQDPRGTGKCALPISLTLESGNFKTSETLVEVGIDYSVIQSPSNVSQRKDVIVSSKTTESGDGEGRG